jgi:hypothetical protein
MPYKTHHADKSAQVCRLADLLEGVPQQETAGLLVEAEKMLLSRESRRGDLGRNSDLKDPYWFEYRLIAEAKKLIKAGKPLEAYLGSLTEQNHGHSGFIDQVRRVYRRPTNEAEQTISEEIRQMIVGVATALIDSAPLSKKMGILGDGWISITAIFDCLTMLGESVPKHLVKQLRHLLVECKNTKTKNDGIPQLEREFENRFG